VRQDIFRQGRTLSKGSVLGVSDVTAVSIKGYTIVI